MRKSKDKDVKKSTQKMTSSGNDRYSTPNEDIEEERISSIRNS